VTPPSVKLSELLPNAIAQAEQQWHRLRRRTGGVTRVPRSRLLASCLKPGKLVVVFGRKSMGKTALALGMAEHVARHQWVPVGLFSLQLPGNEVAVRLLCARANLYRLRAGTKRFRDRLQATVAALSRIPIIISDPGKLTISQFCARARQMKARYGIQLLVVDRFELLHPPADGSMLKRLARKLRIPVVASANVPADKSLLRNADVVALLIRPDQYADNRATRAALRRQACLIISKNRGGPTGDIRLTASHQ